MQAMRPATLASLLLGLSSATSASAHDAHIAEGDTCGVLSSDFLNDSFQGEYLVAGGPSSSGSGGGGCTLGTTPGCYCGPEIDGEERLSEWTWQCGDAITFGPVAPKICPAEVPVPVDDSEEIATMRELGQLNCDLDLNPGGHPGDEVCGYSDCDDGADFSAVCACVDLSRYGVEGGPQWHCLHSTCSCGEEEEHVHDEDGDDPETSAAAEVGRMVILGAGIASIASIASALVVLS
mmetsp:Transcript_3500/g.6757  ORF Transcript_3500/g.6757 Transcript_3500/m.6757 type:complete len:236 (-) Transcript_3500:284-991(-)